ncbi:MAG TPA: hypothetical protein DHW14_07680 [Clostridiales bacterium]|nr:hypothetical protein [Clostridiales bacterium]
MNLEVRPEDFDAWSLGARIYPMLYLLTRVCGARDWGTGQALSANLLGKSSTLNLHHIFPKARFYEHGYTRPTLPRRRRPKRSPPRPNPGSQPTRGRRFESFSSGSPRTAYPDRT